VTGIVIPMRPRDQVPRRIASGATTPLEQRLPVEISGEIQLRRLLRGLRSEGLTARLDEKTCAVVIEEEVSNGPT